MNPHAQRTRGASPPAACPGTTPRSDPAGHADTAAALTVVLPPEQLEGLARRVARLLADDRDDGFLGIDEAAAFLGGCSRKTVYHLVERDRIRCHRLAGRLLFDPAELRADVERGE